MAPPKFGDFSKVVTDIFEDDYTDKQTLKVKTKAGGMGFTVENEKLDAGVAGKLSLKYAHSSGVSVDKLQMKPNGKVALETSVDQVFAPGVNAFYKGDLSFAGTGGVTYKDNLLNTKVEVDVPALSAVTVEAVAGVEDVLAGGMVKYGLDSKKSGLSDYNLAVGYKQKDWFASLSTEKQMGVYKLNAFWQPCPPAKIGTILEVNPSKSTNTLALGTTYVCNPTTTVRVKADSDGGVAAAFAQKCGKNMTIVGSTEVSVKDLSSVKYGASITLG